MIEKRSVERNFSRGSKYYDENAVVQKYMAEKLFEIISKEEIKYNNILEIGCGTGIFSKKIADFFNESFIDLIDISQEMINESQKKIKPSEKTNYFCCDAEKYKADKKYDLIVSNAVFQWFEDIEKVIGNYFEMLNNGGIIAFSVFGEGTYEELKKSFVNANIGYNYIQPFITKERLTNKMVELSGNFSFLEEIYIEKYKSVREFLKYIRDIGANSAKENKPILTPSKIKKVEQIYTENYSEKGEILSTNVLFFCLIKKEK